MKGRNITIKIEASSNIPIKDFSKKFIQQMFEEHFIDLGGGTEEFVYVQQVKAGICNDK